MIHAFQNEHQQFGKSRLLYVPSVVKEAQEVDWVAFKKERIQYLNLAVNARGEVSSVILHPLLEQSAQNIFTNFMSAILLSWEADIPGDLLSAENKLRIRKLLASQEKENGLWSFFSRQEYFTDWDDTSVVRKSFPARTDFDNCQLLDTYEKGQLVETWTGEIPASFLHADADLSVNLNIVEYLLASRSLNLIPKVVVAWSQKVLQQNGKLYFSLYYQSLPFLMYQLAKLFYHFPKNKEAYPLLYKQLNVKLQMRKFVFSNFLSFAFTQNALAYCEGTTNASAKLNLMRSFLQLKEYYSPSPFFYGPGGWYGASAISDLLVLEYLSLAKK
ncbi:MAG: hypothetical protein AB8G15_00710 [Saprospiraceae bacterium]